MRILGPRGFFVTYVQMEFEKRRCDGVCLQ